MKRLTVTSCEARALVLVLTWKDGVLTREFEHAAMRGLMDDAVERGIIELRDWWEDGGGQRVTETSDALFLKRLGECLEREYRFTYVLEDK